MEKKNIGSSFDSWLQEEGIQEQVADVAIRRVRARRVEAAEEREESPTKRSDPIDDEAPPRPGHFPSS